MPARDHLYLPDCHARKDSRITQRLEIHAEGNGDPDALLIRTRTVYRQSAGSDVVDYGPEQRAIPIDRDSARQLFNWLGVWLHTDPG